MNARALEPDAYAWPRDLKKLDYQTSYIGKWHVNPVHNPTDYGYDNYIGLEHYDKFINEKYPERVTES